MKDVMAQVAQPQPLPAPQNLGTGGLEQATMISLLIAAVSATVAALGAIGNKLWGWFERQEKQDSDLTAKLLTTILEERKQLIDVNREGFIATTQALSEIRKGSERVAGAIHDDIQRGMGGQTAIYKSIAESLAEIKAQNRALHERLDGMTDQRRGRENRVHENPSSHQT